MGKQNDIGQVYMGDHAFGIACTLISVVKGSLCKQPSERERESSRQYTLDVLAWLGLYHVTVAVCRPG
jgi:hypothetical protein